MSDAMASPELGGLVSAEYAPDPAACREDIEWFARELKAGSFCETVPKNEPS